MTHKQPHALNEANELFPEVVAELQNYLTEMPATVPVRPEPAQQELNENETSRLTGLLTEGQEVGIT